ncbi:hypothetical protein [Erwinia amylovora]
MNSLFKSTIFAGLLLARNVFAAEPIIRAEQIPQLQQEAQPVSYTHLWQVMSSRLKRGSAPIKYRSCSRRHSLSLIHISGR